MNLKAFIVNKSFWLNLALAIAISLVLLLITTFILNIYTDHGDSFSVPDLNGLNEQQVNKLIEEKQLRYKVLDSLFLKNAEPGTVIDQVPKADFLVKKNRTIFITVCSLIPEQISMPKLTDISYRQALNIMESTSLEIGKIEYKPSQFNNLVLEQMIDGAIVETGRLVIKGTMIDLIIGQASTGKETEVPELIGEDFQNAKEKLGELTLNLGAVIYDRSFNTEEDSLNARVWKQRPNPSKNFKMTQGQSVDLWLTVDEDKLKNVLNYK